MPWPATKKHIITVGKHRYMPYFNSFVITSVSPASHLAYLAFCLYNFGSRCTSFSDVDIALSLLKGSGSTMRGFCCVACRPNSRTILMLRTNAASDIWTKATRGVEGDERDGKSNAIKQRVKKKEHQTVSCHTVINYICKVTWASQLWSFLQAIGDLHPRWLWIG